MGQEGHGSSHYSASPSRIDGRVGNGLIMVGPTVWPLSKKVRTQAQAQTRARKRPRRPLCRILIASQLMEREASMKCGECLNMVEQGAPVHPSSPERTRGLTRLRPCRDASQITRGQMMKKKKSDTWFARSITMSPTQKAIKCTPCGSALRFCEKRGSSRCTPPQVSLSQLANVRSHLERHADERQRFWQVSMIEEEARSNIDTITEGSGHRSIHTLYSSLEF